LGKAYTYLRMSKAPVKWTFMNRSEKPRGYLLEDGTVQDRNKKVIGFINTADFTAGFPNETFAGEIEERAAGGSGLSTADREKFKQFVVMDGKSVEQGMIQELDPGFASVKDGSGKVIVIIDDHGEMTTAQQVTIGKVEGFSRELRPVFALTVLLFARDFIAEEQ